MRPASPGPPAGSWRPATRTEALNLYLHALAVLTPAEPFRTRQPAILRRSQRSPLPAARRRASARDLARAVANEWAFPEWSAAIPKNLTTTLAAARLLKEQGSREADALLDAPGQRSPGAEAATPASAVAPGGAGRGLRTRVALERGRAELSPGDRARWMTRRSSDRGGSTWRTSSCRLDDETQWQTAVASGTGRFAQR